MDTPPRHFSHFYKLLQLVPDEDDISLHISNCAPQLLTQRIHELIPLLRFVNCNVEYVGCDKAIVSIPLLDTAINQNGTQQAAAFYLLADCAFAVAILGALPGVYVSGIHDRCRALPIQLWTKQGAIQHLAPGTGTIKAIAQLPQESVYRCGSS